MEYELTRDWKYSGGAPNDPGGQVLKAGTKLGRIEINDGIPMTPQMLADALQRKLAREVSEPPQTPEVVKQAVSRRVKAKAVEDA